MPEPAPQDYSGDAIRKAVLRRSLGHPLTVIPTGLAAMVATASVVGAAPLFLGAAVILASVGVGSFAMNYFFRAQAIADGYVRGMEKQRDQARTNELKNLRAELQAVGSIQGCKQYDELLAAYLKFTQVLQEREAGGVALDMHTMKEQADATLEEGLMHLRAVVATTRALRAIDQAKLQAEARDLEDRLRRFPARAPSPEHVRARDALSAQLAAIESRLQKYREAVVRIEEILAASEKCESALETSALDVGGMQEVTARFVQDQAASLRETVEAARRFNESMGLGGREDDEADRIYDRPAAAEGPERGAGEAPRARQREKE